MSAPVGTIWLMSSSTSRSEVGVGAGASLRSLTPFYSEAEHGVYLRHLREALDSKRSGLIRNIALTGGYGVGKSSILQQLSQEFKDTTVTLSLPTLGEAAVSASETAGGTPPATSVTNRVQKEIVKQLLYRERPEHVPGSRYRRLTGFNWRRGSGVSFLAAVSLVVVLYLTHAADRLADLMGHGLLQRGFAYAILLALSMAVFTVLQRVFHDRIRIQQFGAGPATVTLADTSNSYFDEYLDEIVYFFEATKVDTLLFEDIDRFDDPHIFEALRELNTILNNCKQLQGRSIRFIYAIKDSIFEQLGLTAAEQSRQVDAAEAEVARANRTKFFDLVIPVVPFITHRSARDLMSGLLEESKLPVSRALVDLAARHVADMRLITNIRNEFVVFREKLLGDDGMPGLSEDQLFAMILYKNVHLSDFELIRTGRSCLDALYRDSRVLVSENMRMLNSRAGRLSQVIADPDPLASRSASLGQQLEAYINRVTLRHRQPPRHGPVDLKINDSMISMDYLQTVAFWRTFLRPDSVLRATIRYQNEPFNFAAGDIGDALGEELMPDRWKEQDQEVARLELAANENDRALLGRADMKDLFSRSDFTMGGGEAARSFAEITSQTLGSQLAVDLVANGYIDQNFTLYASQYHGVHVSSQAMNFILHCVQRNEMDPYFRFDSPTDIDAVLHESGSGVLNGRSIYNIAILDHLLEHRSQDADTVIRRLAAWGPDEREFVQAYVANSKRSRDLIRRLSATWPQTLPLVATDLDEDDQQRADLVNAALLGADPSRALTPDEPVKNYIERNYRRLPAMTNEDEGPTAEHTVTLLKQLDVMLDAIQPLSAAVKRGVVKNRLYTLSKENLIQALDGAEADLTLDNIQGASGDVYAHVLGNLPDYISIALKEPAPRTIAAPTLFASILEDVAEYDPAFIPAIVEHANADCRISNLTDISDATWPALARYQRFPLTFANVSAYVTKLGVDNDLAAALRNEPKIQDWEGTPEADRTALAVEILNAGNYLRDPEIRVQLACSLQLNYYIDAAKISPEEGKLIGLLVAAELVEDNEASYGTAASLSWDTKEFLISKSKNFPEYITSDRLPAEDLRQLLKGKLVADATKRALLLRLRSFTIAADRPTLQTAADCAASLNVSLEPDTLMLLTEATVSGPVIVQLLQPILPHIPRDRLTAILTAIGEPYARLAAPGHRPAKLPNDQAHRELAEHLKTTGVVSSVTKDWDGTTIKVHMKYK